MADRAGRGRAAWIVALAGDGARGGGRRVRRQRRRRRLVGVERGAGRRASRRRARRPRARPRPPPTHRPASRRPAASRRRPARRPRPSRARRRRSPSGCRWSDRELSVFEKVVGDYDAAHPEVEVELVGGVNDDKILQAMRAGDAADVVGLVRLGQRRQVLPVRRLGRPRPTTWPRTASTSTSSRRRRATTRRTTASSARCRSWPTPTACTTTRSCSTKAGLTEPPKTVDELMDYAKKLTVKNADGSLEVVGFDPSFGFFQNTRAVVGAAVGRQVDRRPGQVDAGQRPGLDARC